MMMIDVDKCLDKGKLIVNVWPGLYPMVYVSPNDEKYCPDCAQKLFDNNNKDICSGFVFYEGENIVCELCESSIEPAYGPIFSL